VLPEIVTFSRLYQSLQPIADQGEIDGVHPQAVEAGSVRKRLAEYRQPRRIGVSTEQPVKKRGAASPDADYEDGLSTPHTKSSMQPDSNYWDFSTAF
jgi:hypothetical protein